MFEDRGTDGLHIFNNIFRFSANYSKTNSKFEKISFPLVCRACRAESIDI